MSSQDSLLPDPQAERLEKSQPAHESRSIDSPASADLTIHYLDARDMRCPLPIIKMARIAKNLAPGSQIVVVATDPAAEFDVPAWARLKNHHCSAPIFRNEQRWEVEFTVTLQ